MAPVASHLSVRIWYTINNSPQYILARSYQKLAINVLSSHGDSSSTSGEIPVYATTSLRSCLHSMVQSSPDVMPNSFRDFALYVLDPVESCSAPAGAMSAGGSDGSAPNSGSGRPVSGVAVALGPMSVALSSPEVGSTVTGTLVKTNTGEVALEVIFALRETPHIQQMQLLQAFSAWQSGHPHEGMAHSTPDVQSQHSLYQAPQVEQKPVASAAAHDPPSKFAKSSDFPLPYIGPPKPTRARKERPRPSTSSRSNSSRSNTSRSNPPRFRDLMTTAPLKSKKQAASPQRRNKFLVEQKPERNHVQPARRPAAASLASSSLSHASSSSSSTAPIPNLMSLLSSNPNFSLEQLSTLVSQLQSSNSHDSQSLPLVNTLLQLLARPASAVVAPMPPTEPTSDSAQTPASESQTSTAGQTSDDEEIIVLEKENIDPTAFRRRTESSSIK
ncbi:hypothetical protein EWM64_g9726, partial [Hericium alpestre]